MQDSSIGSVAELYRFVKESYSGVTIREVPGASPVVHISENGYTRNQVVDLGNDRRQANQLANLGLSLA